MTSDTPQSEPENAAGGDAAPADAGRARVRGRQHPGARRAGSRSQAARHVHRVDRAARSAPLGVRDRRQLRRRGAGRVLRRHHRDDSRGRRSARRRQRARHPGRQAQDREQIDARGRADGAARRRQVRRRRVRGVRWPARRGLVGRERAVEPARRGREDQGQRLSAVVLRRRVPRGGSRQGRGDERDRHNDHVLAGSGYLHRDASNSSTRCCAPGSSRWRS